MGVELQERSLDIRYQLLIEVASAEKLSAAERCAAGIMLDDRI